LFIVPAYNEGGNIEKTIEDIKSCAVESTVLVINDGSDDDTASKAASAGSKVVSLPFNLGIGGAVQTGFIYAKRYHYDYAVRMDGDGQHDGKYIQDLLKPVVHDEVDMTIGSRFLSDHCGYQSSWLRRIGIHFFANLLSALTGCKLTDPTSGFTAYNRKMILAFSKRYPYDFPEPEAIMVAKRMGARIREIPVIMRQRTSGQSSLHFSKSFYYMIKVTCAILLNLIKKQET